MQLVSDREGSVMFGWVGSNVYYSRFTGRLSAELGTAHVRALESAMTASATIRYFGDSRNLTSYDLLARSEFARLLLSKRKQFVDVVILNRKGDVSASARVLMETMGRALIILDEPSEFEKRLLLVAPGARDLPKQRGTRRQTPHEQGAPPGPTRPKR